MFNFGVLPNSTVTALLLSAALALPGCAINPATGKLDTVTMSESREISMGKELHEEMIKTVPLYEDEAINEYVRAVGKKVAAASDRPDIEYHFFIIDSPDINAFALPGGYIYVNRGLLNYLQNEAQLAAVLGHEIAHVTARHHVRQKSASTGRNVGAVFAGILTGSYTVASAAAEWGSAAAAGYGREMELEADGFGAQYMKDAGYSPDAMIDVLAILKAHERFSKQQARDAGRKVPSYHGVFTSHPSSDQRLLQAVADAKEGESQSTGAKGELKAEEFRDNTDGIIWGDNHDRIAQAAEAAAKASEEKQDKENRYIHNRLGFTIVFPQQWQVANQGAVLTSAPDDNSAEMQLRLARVDPKTDFETVLRDQFDVKLLKQSEPLSQFGLRGHTGIKPGKARDGSEDQRVAILVHGNRAYLLEGSVNKPEPGVDYDQLFLASIRTLQPVAPRAPSRLTTKHSKTIKYVVANDNTTFARLANELKIGNYGEEYLRLINGYYPRGEPYPGEIIKIIQ
ncbi:M48 family metalloprotease [Halioxenophilus aromaticivorans]|uniref:M48 family metalloprotease n=1 Tax=Halioxenophilus aromaticivorans TaxID=1306992 RepID=A0AAV3U5S5_9ALTE